MNRNTVTVQWYERINGDPSEDYVEPVRTEQFKVVNVERDLEGNTTLYGYEENGLLRCVVLSEGTTEKVQRPDWDEAHIPLEHFKFDTVAEHITQLIMNDPEVTRWCDQVARESSGTVNWSADDFEAYEQTHQYDLYWSSYAAAQVKLINAAAVKLGPLSEFERSQG